MSDPLPDFLLSRAQALPVPESSPDFEARVLAGVARCRRKEAGLRMAIGAAVPLLLVLFFVGTAPLRMTWERQRATRSGTAWLLAHQREDGGWSAATWGGHERFSTGVGALATLALLRQPEPLPTERLLAADAWLRARLDPSAALADEGPGLYNHLFALHALLALEARLPDPERARLLRHAVAHLLRQQQPDGGWGYNAPLPMGYAPHSLGRSNSAVTWWVLRLLRDAEPLGLPALPRAIERGENWLSARLDAPDGATYQEGLPPCGPDSALFWMARLRHPDATPPSTRLTPDAYRDLFRLAARKTRDDIVALLREQRDDGAWSRPQDRWWAAGGQIYATAAALLILAP